MRHFLLIILSINLIGCSNPEKRARHLIKQELKETLHDWDSYESVKFSGLDSMYTTVFDNIDYAFAYKKDSVFRLLYDINTKSAEENSYKAVVSNTISDREFYKEMAQMSRNAISKNLDSIQFYSSIIDSIQCGFKPVLKSLCMLHSFRCNNAGGHKTIHHYRFVLDENISKILYSENVGYQN